MKVINRYVIISICCGFMMLVSVIYLLNKPYPYDELNSYIIIDSDYFDDYKKVQLHELDYATLLEIPTPDKKGLIMNVVHDKESKSETLLPKGESVEFYVKHESTYKVEFFDNHNRVYETIIDEDKYSINVETIGSLFDEIKLTVLSGDSFGIHYIGIIKSGQESVINQKLPESGLVRSQLRDIATTSDELKELAIVDPYKAIGAVAFYDSYDNGDLGVKVLNIHERIITLLGIETDKGEVVTSIDHIKIEAIDMETVNHSDDLVYHELHFQVEKDVNIDNLYLRYYISGGPSESVVKLNIFPRYSDVLYSETQVNRDSNLDEFSFVNIENNVISFIGNQVIIDKIMFIPNNHILKINEGQTIDLIQGAYITSSSHVEFRGTKDKPIRVITSDDSGKGIFVNEGNRTTLGITKSIVDYTVFDGMNTPSSGAFVLTGAVTFYKTDVMITNSSFINNVCEDSLNIVSSIFEVDSCFFDNAPSDCLDGDFSEGIISNSTFENIAGDAIDFSASLIEVNNCEMINVLDKAVSGGEKSTIHVKNININNAQIGLASKDSSKVYGDQLYITNTKIGYMLYQKKPEYGGGYMEVTNSVFEDNGGIPYLLQTGSTLYMNDIKIANLERKNQDEIIEKVINGEPIE